MIIFHILIYKKINRGEKEMNNNGAVRKLVDEWKKVYMSEDPLIALQEIDGKYPLIMFLLSYYQKLSMDHFKVICLMTY